MCDNFAGYICDICSFSEEDIDTTDNRRFLTLHFHRNVYSYIDNISEDDDGEGLIHKLSSIFNYLTEYINNENSIDDIVNSSSAGYNATKLSKSIAEKQEQKGLLMIFLLFLYSLFLYFNSKTNRRRN